MLTSSQLILTHRIPTPGWSGAFLRRPARAPFPSHCPLSFLLFPSCHSLPSSSDMILLIVKYFHLFWYFIKTLH